MKIQIHITIQSDDGQVQDHQQIACLQRGALSPEELGMNLAEAKELLHSVQETMVRHQAAEYVRQQSCCAYCGTTQSQKGSHQIVCRTLFGKLQVASPRLHHCRCQATAKRSFSPLAELLPERTAPELLYLETKWATLMSFEETRDLLGEVLPLGEELNAPAIRLNVHKIAERMEQALGAERQIFLEARPAEEDGLPEPVPPLTVGLDGAYVHNRDQQSRQEGWFEVVTGKSVTATGEAKCFAFVLKYNPKPRRRLYEVLKSQGLQSNTPLTFLSDGEETMRNLQLYLGAPSEHWLDWFHITKRLTVMGQMRKGMQGIETPALVSQMEEELESLKWNLWNGNILPALRIVDGLEVQLAGEQISEKRMKLLKAVREIGAYITVNQASIPDYGDRYRNQELISTAFVESTVNQVVSKRMEKNQQMRWTPRGAHLLLQVRTRVLNGELRQMFCQWYPGMQSASSQERNLAAVA